MSVKLSLDASGYTQGIEKASEKTREYTNQITKISKDLPNLTREMKMTKKETENLTLAVSRLTEEQRNSAEGQAMIRMLEESKQKAAELTDMLDDTRHEIKTMASDTLELDAATEAVSVLGNSFATLQGTIGLVTGDTEKMKRAVTAFTTVQSALNAATSIGNAIQKQSALMTVLSTKYTKIKTIVTRAATIAEIRNTAATNKGKVGQNSFNMALAIGKALLGDWKSLIVAAGVAVGGYAAITAMTAEDTKKLQEEEEKAKKEEEALMKSQKEHDDMIRDKYASTVADLTSKYKELQQNWKELKTETEKNQAFKEAKKALQDMGFAVNSIVDVDNILLSNEGAMVKYFDAVGRAAAYAALKMEAFKKAAELQWDLAQKQKEIKGQNKAGTEMSADYVDRYKLKEGKDYKWKNPNGVHDRIVLTDEGADKVNEKAVKKSSEILGIEKEIKKVKEEQAYWDKNLLKTKKEQADILKGANINPYVDKDGSSKTTKPKDKDKNALTPEEKKALQERTNELIQYYKDNPIKISIDYSEDEIEDKIKKLQTKLKNTPLTIDGVFNPEVDKIKGQIETWEEKLKPKKSIVDEEEFTNSITRGIESSKKALQDWDDAQTRSKEQKLEEFNQIGEGIQTIGGMMTSISQLTDDKAINIMAIVGQAIANVALGFSKALAKEGKLGVWDWIAAAATGLATMVSVQQVIKQQTSGYATGGVVGGNSYTGDNLLVRVNSKERILTAKQNKALNDGLAQINSFDQVGRLYGTVTVKGSDLNIAMKNFNKTQKKSR